MPHSLISDLGLHCLPVILLGVSRIKWLKNYWTSGKFCCRRDPEYLLLLLFIIVIIIIIIISRG